MSLLAFKIFKIFTIFTFLSAELYSSGVWKFWWKIALGEFVTLLNRNFQTPMHNIYKYMQFNCMQRKGSHAYMITLTQISWQFQTSRLTPNQNSNKAQPISVLVRSANADSGFLLSELQCTCTPTSKWTPHVDFLRKGRVPWSCTDFYFCGGTFWTPPACVWVCVVEGEDNICLYGIPKKSNNNNNKK